MLLEYSLWPFALLGSQCAANDFMLQILFRFSHVCQAHFASSIKFHHQVGMNSTTPQSSSFLSWNNLSPSMYYKTNIYPKTSCNFQLETDMQLLNLSQNHLRFLVIVRVSVRHRAYRARRVVTPLCAFPDLHPDRITKIDGKRKLQKFQRTSARFPAPAQLPFPSCFYIHQGEILKTRTKRETYFLIIILLQGKKMPKMF